MGCEQLEVYQVAHRLAVEVHEMTLTLPPFELHEEGSQIRRSSERVAASIVEGYALRRYRDEFLHYLYRALASSGESIEHLTILGETGSLRDKQVFRKLKDACRDASSLISRFITGVQRHHTVPFQWRTDH